MKRYRYLGEELTLRRIASTFDGALYGAEVSVEESNELERHGLVMVFGRAGKLVVFAGAWETVVEVQPWASLILAPGPTITRCIEDPGVELEVNVNRQGAWSFRLGIPAEPFRIVDPTGEARCHGLLFDLERLTPARVR
jgi:hypothetical protein